MASDPSAGPEVADAGEERALHDGRGVPASSPLVAVSWPVHTARLQLRPATPGDAESSWPYRRLGPVNHWIPRAPHTVEEHRAAFEHPAHLAKTLVVELEGAVIGDLMLAVEDAWAQVEVAERARGVQAELGWALHPDYAGRGYATEAVRELIRICFTDLGLRRVTAGCFAGNEASWRLMERVGMRREAYTVRDSLHRSGAWLDGMTYALLADEWRQSGAGTGTGGDAQPAQPPS
jgi:RimJ/RimL family protein N-acetyltransferase